MRFCLKLKTLSGDHIIEKAYLPDSNGEAPQIVIGSERDMPDVSLMGDPALRVRALMPESEIGDLIIEVRSATAGVGTFTAKFDHMAELTGKPAEQIVAVRKAAAAAA